MPVKLLLEFEISECRQPYNKLANAWVYCRESIPLIIFHNFAMTMMVNFVLNFKNQKLSHILIHRFDYSEQRRFFTFILLFMHVCDKVKGNNNCKARKKFDSKASKLKH